MKKLILLVVLAVALTMSAFVAKAAAVILPYNACYGYEWGKLAQDRNGAWYRCAWTGNGPTGFQWWRL